MPAAVKRRRRSETTARGAPVAACTSSKRRSPRATSRTMSSAQRSPTTVSASARLLPTVLSLDYALSLLLMAGQRSQLRSVQGQNSQQRRTDGLHLGAVQPASELTEARLRIDHCQLLDHHAGLGALDFDLRAKRCRPPSGRGRRDDPRRTPHARLAPRRLTYRAGMPMNAIHRRLCRSHYWTNLVRSHLLPWALQGVSLDGEVLEIGPGYGVTTRWLAQRSARLTAIEVEPAAAPGLPAG